MIDALRDIAVHRRSVASGDAAVFLPLGERVCGAWCLAFCKNFGLCCRGRGQYGSPRFVLRGLDMCQLQSFEGDLLNRGNALVCVHKFETQ